MNLRALRKCGIRNVECGIDGVRSIHGSSPESGELRGPFRIPHSALRIGAGRG